MYKEVSGLEFAYGFLCERKLWFYSHGIQMEQENEDVMIGKIIEESAFKKENKNLFIDNSICIDYVKDGIVYEIKKSKAQKEMSIYQMKFYLYHLYKKGIKNPIGILKIPKIKYQEEVHLDEEDIVLVERKIAYFKEIMEREEVPKGKEIRACKKCAYYALCKI